MTGRVVDLGAVRELRRLIDGLDAEPGVEQVRAISRAAWRARDRRWMRWAAQAFDEAHERTCSCQRTRPA